MPSPLDQPETDTPVQTPDDSTTDTQSGSTQKRALEYASAEQVKEEDKVHSLDLGEGNVVKLDALGPMIVNSDGVS